MREIPKKVDKPWGYELWWARTDRYVGKILHVDAGHLLSCQYHEKKDETMHVLRGELILRLQEQGGPMQERLLRQGESVRIPARLIHQIEAVVDSDVLEASTPELDDPSEPLEAGGASLLVRSSPTGGANDLKRLYLLIAAGARTGEVEDHRPAEDYLTFRCSDPDGTEIQVFWQAP